MNSTMITSGWVMSLAAAILNSLLLWAFVRRFSKNYSREWLTGSISLAVSHAATLIVVTRSAEISRWLLIGLVGVSVVSGFVHAAFLVSGSTELARQRPLKLKERRRLVVGLASLGLTVGLLSSFVFTAEELYGALTVPRSAVAAVASLGTGFLIGRFRALNGGIGFRCLSLGMIITGLAELVHAILATTAEIEPISATLLGASVFAAAIAQAVTGIFMPIAVLDDEREAAVLAASHVEHLAYHDALTGLPNRALFFDRVSISLSQAARADYRCAVFFFDLDRFKEINDSLGHSVGDVLLKNVAKRVRDSVRQGDTLARFGGDEFTLFVHRLDNLEHASRIAQKITDAIKLPFIIGDRELVITTSVGVALYPDDGSDAETLVKHADSAMYRAKDMGRDNFQLYTSAMGTHALERLELENRLRKAQVQGELEVYSQPIVDLTTTTTVGFEALLRWNHPQLGLLGPDQFIPAAEISGLIVSIGAWVLETACTCGAKWSKREGRPLSVSVNLSPRQFQQPDLVKQVEEILERVRIEPGLVELEITESAAMQNAEQSIRVMRELKDLGVRLAIDDFGTGYSSLSYLKRFPIDTLKLDRSFIRDLALPRTAAIVSAIVTMSHTLGLKVTAEGVEEETQLEILRRNGCDSVQGFLFSKPLTAHDFAEHLVAESSRLLRAVRG